MTKNTESKIALAIMLCLCAIGSIAASATNAAENERNTEMANETPIATDYSGVREYIGARYVPVFANPLEWSDTRGYEPLTIVSYNGNSYTSMQSVPPGTPITDTTMWASTGNYNAQVEAYRQEVQQWSGQIETANDKASEAMTKAESANTTANSALSSASSAVTAANEAKANSDSSMDISSEALQEAQKTRAIQFGLGDCRNIDPVLNQSLTTFMGVYFPESNTIILTFSFSESTAPSIISTWKPLQLPEEISTMIGTHTQITVGNAFTRFVSTDPDKKRSGDLGVTADNYLQLNIYLVGDSSGAISNRQVGTAVINFAKLNAA